MNSTLTKLEEAGAAIKKRLQDHLGHQNIPEVAVTLGSGLGLFCEALADGKLEIPYDEIPHFHQTTVKGHEGKLVIGSIEETPVLVLQGRIHAYEGHSLEEVIFPTRLVRHLGVKTLLLTNASGGMNPNYRTGDLVMIKDHINFTGLNPLRGANIEELGPRFPDMSTTWTPAVRESIQKAAQELSYELKDGVYFGVMGPSYETPCEIEMFRKLGGDMVGMSTVAEAIAARHCGLQLGGLSCITNMAAGIHDGELNHQDIKEEANKIKETFVQLLTKTIKHSL